MSLVNGTLELLAEPGPDWVAAVLNTPVASGASLRTPPQSRAEVRIGSAALQIGANAQFTVQALDDQSLVLVLQRGNIALSLRELLVGEHVEVRAADAVFTISAPGSYRFGHAPLARRFEVRVFAGAGAFSAPGASAPPSLTAGQQAQVDARTLAVLGQGDAQLARFDEWAAQRAQRVDRVAPGGFVSPEMTGADELDSHGRWRVDPRVGAVWYPNGVDAEWAPYRAGHWAWVAPWGWTWIDDAPWGFAPSHYGRWLFIAGRWGWVPGRYVARPAFAPALVGFYGRGPTAATPWVGWFPLAPGEAYQPGFVASARHVERLNVGASIGVNPGGYRYAQTSFAVTAVAPEAFGTTTSAAGASRLPLSPAALSGAGVSATHGAPVPAPAAAAAAVAAVAAGAAAIAAPSAERALAPTPAARDTAKPDASAREARDAPDARAAREARAARAQLRRDGTLPAPAATTPARGRADQATRAGARREPGAQAKGRDGRHCNPAGGGCKQGRVAQP